MKKLSVLSMALMCSSLSYAKGAEYSITTMMGSDSNPYRFSEKYPTKSTNFLDLDVTAKWGLSKRWSTEMQIGARQYSHTDDWADKQKLSMEIQYQGRSKKHPSEFKVSVEQQDKTYVSRLNGGLSSYSGQSLDDRYDFTQLDVLWLKKRKLSSYYAWQYRIKFKRKNYEDFSAINISDLDYSALTLGSVIEHKITRNQVGEWALDLTYRAYSDRAQVSVNGDALANTQLGYYDSALQYAHTLKTSKRHKVIAKIAYEKRQDNGSGYYDTHKSTLEIKSKYRIAAKASFSASYQFSGYAYERASNQGQASTVEEYTANNKHQVKLTAKVKLKALGLMDAQWLTGYRYEQVSADKSVYSYERHQLEIGLKFKY